MAVYYKWIKGCCASSTLTSGLWTYLKWGASSNSVLDDVSRLPTLHSLIEKNDDFESMNEDEASSAQLKNLGYILTNNASGIKIQQSWGFNYNKSLDFYDNASTPAVRATFYTNGDTTFYTDVKDWTINDLSNSNWTMIHLHGGDTKKIEFGGNYSVEVNGIFKALNDAEFQKPVVIKDSTASSSSTTGALKVTGGIGVGGAIYSGSSCNATFFNATSDKRAKENIQLATYNALELIKKLPVYIYNYKNQTETVTGILAQDLLEAQPKELELVSNINACGENNDYMSIKHDKLMFVLMKAIQEQQEQIERLEKEIQKLKNI